MIHIGKNTKSTIVSDIVSSNISIPILTTKDYTIPGFVDNNTLVGGKAIEFDIPGNSFIISETVIDTPQGGVVPIPDAGGGQISGCSVTLRSPGGGGADCDNDVS